MWNVEEKRKTLTTDPTDPTDPAGEGVGDIGEGVPVLLFQLVWYGDGACGRGTWFAFCENRKILAEKSKSSLIFFYLTYQI